MAYLGDLLASPQAWLALLTLTAMEIVLGIDNILFISVLVSRLPHAQRQRVRRLGIGLALLMRLVLLAAIAWIVALTAPVVTLFGNALSWRDLILIGGGFFLVAKATTEIHHQVGPPTGPGKARVVLGVAAAIGQIVLLDLVFSLDSIITAVGMTPHIPIMVTAVLIAVATMLVAAEPLGEFVHRHPSVVMLALAFLLTIGMTLVAEGFGLHVPKGYLYTAMAFSAAVEALNQLARRKLGTGSGPAP